MLIYSVNHTYLFACSLFIAWFSFIFNNIGTQDSSNVIMPSKFILQKNKFWIGTSYF